MFIAQASSFVLVKRVQNVHRVNNRTELHQRQQQRYTIQRQLNSKRYILNEFANHLIRVHACVLLKNRSYSCKCRRNTGD